MAADRALAPAPEIALTTNGIGLAARADGLAAAGLDRINISLDTLDPETFKRLTRRRRLQDVLAGVAAARGGRSRAGQDQHRADARRQRPRGARPAALGDARGRPAAVHRADAAGRPARLAALARWSPPPRSASGSARRRAGRGPSRRAARGSAPAELFRVVGTEHRSASSRRCPSRSAAPVTGSGSPPTARSATACSRGPSPICAPAARRGQRRRDRRTLGARGGRQAPGHGIDDPTFLQPDRPMSAIGG